MTETIAPSAGVKTTDRRRVLTGLAIGGVLLGLAPLRGQGGRGAARVHNLLDDLPDALRSAVAARTATPDLAGFFDRAARRALAEGLPLHVPAGTYPMLTWSPPRGLTVLTDSRATVFRQLDTRGRPQRFIEVAADGVSLWPGGAATIDGGMTPRGTNATGFNSGVRVHAAAGVRIDSFACGDIHGHNIGGDVVETGCDAEGILGRCTVGSLYGDNVYRNILSVTGGRSGTVVAVIQTGGCGFMTVDVEPNPTSAPVGDWRIGTVRGHRATVAGDAAAGVGSVAIGELDLDRNRPSSVPPLDGGGVSERRIPALFATGLRYRNVGSLRVERARIANFPRAAIADIGEAAADSPSGEVLFGALEIVRCGEQSGYQVNTHKTRLLRIASIAAVEKASPAVATFLASQRMTLIQLGGGRIWGRAVLGAEGNIEAEGLAVAGAADHVFRNVRGRITLSKTTVADAAVLFGNCSGTIAVEDSDLEATTLALRSAPIAVVRSKVNGRFLAAGRLGP